MRPLTRRQFFVAASGLAIASNAVARPASGIEIRPRDEWGADLPPKGPLSSEDVRFLIVHHSASHAGHQPAEARSILRSWYHFHTGPDKGWPDIAYNFVIDSGGGIWEARQGSLAGAVAGSATGGNQGFSQLVCLIGDTNVEAPTADALNSLVRLLAWLADRYGVSTAAGAEVAFESKGSNKWPAGALVTTPTIAGHRDMSQTTCPGDILYGYVEDGLRADVEAMRIAASLDSAPASSTTTTQAETTTTTAPITTTTRPATSIPSTTVASPTTTLTAGGTAAAASEPSGASTIGWAAAGLISVVAGLAAWRMRRMGNGDS